MHFIDRTLIRNSVILAVDDSPVLLDALDISIGELCKEFIVATSAEHAIKIVTEKLPDLVLLDIEMPRINGFELFEKLKELTAIARIPVIFLTSMEDKKIEAKALEIGAVDYITKPFDRTVLLHRINTHLNISYYCTNLEGALQSVENGLVNTFSSLLESRDKNTSGHALRTSFYLEILGQELISNQGYTHELNDSLLKRMVRAAPLHDIGKIGVPDNVLLKPGAFDDKEFETMKTHAYKGARVLGNLYRKMPSQYYLFFAEQIALNHHERYDGSGYPNGLSGEAIPFSARLMAVADVYDALTQNRVYRTAMNHEKAYQVIVENRGKQFDPIITDAFEKTHDKLRVIMEQSEPGE
ncbi:MAG: response regulator [Fibromonadaceae bacterium]|nr:response regulator [Fibromonadaceae bacterium]